jgi:alkanesulfonate monooxygenase SsuD/methylene tetrahydromethanopterin reductase-like flavin-dependent oxidoreductase (luciferase family)
VPSVPPPVQKDGPPILMGGGGKLILRASGRCADAVTIAGQPMAKSDGLPNWSALGERVQWVAAAADEVGRHPELHILLSQVVVTSNARTAARDLLAGWPGGAARPPTEDELLASPFIAIGSVARITEQLLGLREEFGISFISVRASMAAEMVPVIEAMANR